MPETVPVDREHEIPTPYGSLYAQVQSATTVFIHPARLETVDLDGNRDVSHEPSITVDGRSYFVRCWASYIDGLWILGDRHSRYAAQQNPAGRIIVEADSTWRNEWGFRSLIAKRERRVAELIAEPLIVAFREWAEHNDHIFVAERRRQALGNKQGKVGNLRYELSQAQRFVENLPNRHRELDEEAERYRQKAAVLEPQIADLEAEIETLETALAE